MSRYNVHAYLTVRVKVKGVSADDHQEAIAKAEEAILDNPHRALERGLRLAKLGLDECVMSDDVVCAEFADEITGFLVDEEGDEEHSKTAAYDANFMSEVPFNKENQHPCFRFSAWIEDVGGGGTDKGYDAWVRDRVVASAGGGLTNKEYEDWARSSFVVVNEK